MDTQTKNRTLYPVLIPLAVVGVVAASVGGFALILLYNTRVTAVTLAIVAAAAILGSIALAATRDKLDGARKGAVALTGAAPIVIGALIASGVVGGLADEDLNINRKPHEAPFVSEAIAAGAPTIAATSVLSFCLPTPDGCSDTNEWSFAYGGGELVYGFDNRNDGVAHNLKIYEVDDLANATLPLSLAALSDDALITPGVPPDVIGPAQQGFAFEPDAELPQALYFVCSIHPSTMFGVLTFSS